MKHLFKFSLLRIGIDHGRKYRISTKAERTGLKDGYSKITSLSAWLLIMRKHLES